LIPLHTPYAAFPELIKSNEAGIFF
jgi:hypothetical protein